MMELNFSSHKLIVGNWKMYKTSEEAISFAKSLRSQIPPEKGPVLLAAPFTAIWPLAKETQSSELAIGAQTMNESSEGAFTGEIAGRMIKEAGAQFVLLGHSERREHFGETNEKIKKKIERALEVGLLPIICLGEGLKEQEEGQEESFLTKQIEEMLDGVVWKKDIPLVLAYEPVWAIGTGKAAKIESVEKLHRLIKEKVQEMVSLDAHVLYGGSVSPENCQAFLSLDEVDGLLVGGSSLQLEPFLRIIENS